ncbi:MAG: hypothetical protein KatS3mg102_2716 [Planctomycetota bacterium]|nr:MAG: hypothetical protein KatS3mg102_2716 [Planctomycetota bacterium]
MAARPWLMRTYAGHTSAAASNALFRANLAKGQTGLSIAFDLPTQLGLDPDDPQARGEVGRVGVPIASLADMQVLFDGIPLERTNTSMTINATAPWLYALYVALAERRGAPVAELRGTTQNDLLKEFLARGTYIFPPEPSLRLQRDLIAYAVGRTPHFNPINLCSYHLQEAGAEPVEEIAFTLAAAIAVLDAVRTSGAVPAERFAQLVGRISFFLSAGMRFIDEACKVRAFARLWDEICRERYGVAEPRLRRFRYGVQVNSLELTAQQPELNLARIVIEALGVLLPGRERARALQLPAWNEALGLPRPWDQQVSLRIQQLLAYETDLLEHGDILAGSPAIEARTAELLQAARAELQRIERLGGAIAALRSGYLKARLVAAQARRLRALETGARKKVGVNCFTDTEPSPLLRDGERAILQVDPAAEREVIERLQAVRRARDPGVVARALAALQRAAAAGHNVLPASIGCAHAGVTTGEWTRALREVLRLLPGADGAGGRRRRGRARGRGRGAARAARAAARAGAGARQPARPPAAGADRQAGPGRPLQRRRAAGAAGAAERAGGDLPGDPAHARADREGGAAGGRGCGGAVDFVRGPPDAGTGGAGAAGAARGPPAGGGGRGDPARGRGGALRRGRRAGVDLGAGGPDRRRGGAARCDRAAGARGGSRTAMNETMLPLGVVPPLGETPPRMLAHVIRKERHGPPRQAMQIEEVAVPEPGTSIPTRCWCCVLAAGVNYNGVWAALGQPISRARACHRAALPHRRLRCRRHRLGGRPRGAALDRPGDEVIVHCNQELTATDEQCNGGDPMLSPTSSASGAMRPRTARSRSSAGSRRSSCCRGPPQLTCEEAACYTLALATAYRMLFGHAAARTLKPGDNGCWSGGPRAGLGSMAVQLCRRRRRATPSASSPSDDKRGVRAAGSARCGVDRPPAVHAAGAGCRRRPIARATPAYLRSGSRAREHSARRSGSMTGKGNDVDIVFEHPGEATFPVALPASSSAAAWSCSAPAPPASTSPSTPAYVWMRQKRIQGSHFATSEAQASGGQPARHRAPGSTPACPRSSPSRHRARQGPHALMLEEPAPARQHGHPRQRPAPRPEEPPGAPAGRRRSGRGRAAALERAGGWPAGSCRQSESACAPRAGGPCGSARWNERTALATVG